MKEFRENNKITSKTAAHQVANNASQALLESKNDFKNVTSQIIEEFKDFDQENTPPETFHRAQCTLSIQTS